HRRPLHAAVRPAVDPDHAAHADALGRHDAAREHAGAGAAAYAGGADYALHRPVRGHPVPRCRVLDGVAAAAGAGRDWRGVVPALAGAVPQIVGLRTAQMTTRM